LPSGASFTDHGNGTGTFSWIPEKGQAGLYDVTFIASDGDLEDSCIVEITVNEEENLPPEAQDDYAEVEEDSFNNVVDVLSNDSDPNNDSLIIISVTDPLYGTIFNHDSHITYNPDSDYCGDDEFSYTVHDGHGGTDTAMVFIKINCVNDPPKTPGKPSGPTQGKAGVQLTYYAVTTDPDNDDLSYLFDWGDGTTSGWTEPVPMGTNASAFHKWSEGTYYIKVKADDGHGLQTGWSEHLSITIPRSRESRVKESKSTSARHQFFSDKSALTSQPQSLNTDRFGFNLNTNPFFNCFKDGKTIWIFFRLVLRIIHGDYNGMELDDVLRYEGWINEKLNWR
jgi:hypothetical protein